MTFRDAIVRDATLADIPWLAATSADIYRHVFATLIDGFDPSPFDRAHFVARFQESWRQIRIAGSPDEPAGFHLTSEGTIAMFFVASETRGAGIGRGLLRDAEQRGARDLECFAANRPARHFYERQGWAVASAYERLFGGRQHAFVRYAKCIETER